MSEEQEPTKETEVEPNGEAGVQGQEEKDWKSIARMWENRAKANQKKAEKLDEIEEANKSELEKANERVAKLEGELNSMKEQEARKTLVDSISQETGVPASLLNGDDEDALRSSAAALSEWLNSQKVNVPADAGGGTTAPTITKEAIEAIKDPVERVRTRAQHPDLYK